MTALAAVAERKVLEEGGEVGDEDVGAKAQRIQRSLAAKAARERRRDSPEGAQAAYRERKAIDTHLGQLVESLDPTYMGYAITEKGSIRGGRETGVYTVRAGDYLGAAAIFFRSTGAGPGGVAGEKLVLCCGSVADYDRIKDQFEVYRYELELAEDDQTWRWVDEKGRQYTSGELAEAALRWLLDEHERRRTSELERQRQR